MTTSDIDHSPSFFTLSTQGLITCGGGANLLPQHLLEAPATPLFGRFNSIATFNTITVFFVKNLIKIQTTSGY